MWSSSIINGEWGNYYPWEGNDKGNGLMFIKVLMEVIRCTLRLQGERQNKYECNRKNNSLYIRTIMIVWGDFFALWSRTLYW